LFGRVVAMLAQPALFHVYVFFLYFVVEKAGDGDLGRSQRTA
jgi:hypothetical protein